MEGGRRPDVILLVEDKVIILEFEIKSLYSRSDCDQLKGYYRDITSYHKESAKFKVIPFLMTTMCNGKYRLLDKYHICFTDMFIESITSLRENSNLQIDVKRCINSEYAPLPTWIVLLTRAKKGMNLHIPDKKELNYTRKFFKDIGAIEI